MSPEHYAKEAALLLENDVLKHALGVIRAEALEALAAAPAHDTIAVLRLQQKVAVVDDIRSELSNAVLRTATANSPGTFA